MKSLIPLLVLLCVLLTARPGKAQELSRIELKVDGTVREALLHLPPAKEKAAALVFVFHGHGGNMRQAARSFSLQTQWPEAIVVYPQGLNTPGQLTDKEGTRAGWQHAPGDQGDRDLKFFDALLTKLKQENKVDERRIHATGHSNGGAFTYLLWAERGDLFASMAPSAAVYRHVDRLKPKPVMHLAGSQDPLVKFAWQERMMEVVRRIDGCEANGSTWAPNATLYTSKSGPPVVTHIHPGGHQFPADAPALIVRFFKQHAKPETPETKKD